MHAPGHVHHLPGDELGDDGLDPGDPSGAVGDGEMAADVVSKERSVADRDDGQDASGGNDGTAEKQVTPRNEVDGRVAAARGPDHLPRKSGIEQAPAEVRRRLPEEFEPVMDHPRARSPSLARDAAGGD